MPAAAIGHIGVVEPVSASLAADETALSVGVWVAVGVGAVLGVAAGTVTPTAAVLATTSSPTMSWIGNEPAR
jgi:hypothetical protein